MEFVIQILFALVAAQMRYGVFNDFFDVPEKKSSKHKAKRRYRRPAKKVPFTAQPSVYYRNIKLEKSGDLLIYIIAVSAHFIKLDKKIASSEIEFCEKHFNEFLGNNESNEIANQLLSTIINTDIPIKYLTQVGSDKLKYNDKLKIADFLIGLSESDWDSSELEAIKQFSKAIGIKDKDFDYISKGGYDMTEKDNIWLSDWMGELSDHYQVNRLFRTDSFKGDKRDDLHFADKIYQISGLLNEKDFEDRLADIKDSRLSDQYKSLNNKLSVFLDILSEKMNPEEISYQRYKSIFKKVYLQAVKNIKQSVLSKQIINSLDEEGLKKEISKLRKDGNEDLVNIKEDRLKLFEDELLNLNGILVNNDRAIQEMEEVTFEIGRLKGTKGEDHRVIDQAIKELDDWTQKVEVYNKK